MSDLEIMGIAAIMFALGLFTGWLTGQASEWERQARRRLAYFSTDEWKQTSYESKGAIFTFFEYLRRES